MNFALPSILKKKVTIEDFNKLPCEHEWAVIGKTFARPRHDIKPEGLDKETQQMVLFGVTTILWECNHCHTTRKEQVLGSDENQWLNIVDQVEQHGMQYVKEGDKVYAVAKVPPATNPAPTR